MAFGRRKKKTEEEELGNELDRITKELEKLKGGKAAAQEEVDTSELDPPEPPAEEEPQQPVQQPPQETGVQQPPTQLKEATDHYNNTYAPIQIPNENAKLLFAIYTEIHLLRKAIDERA